LREGDERYFVTLSAPIIPASAIDTQQISSTGGSPHHVEMWWLPHADKNAPTLLYYHGTFRNLFQNLHKIDALRQAGFAVLAVEYRGWGVSTPITPSEQSIMQDADLAWAELKRREPRAAQRVIYGHSMGSGVAVDVASRLHAMTDYGALILESALTSFRDVAYEAGFLARLLALFNNEHFVSIDKISRITAPLLMIHGSLDTTIPIRVGEKLFAVANSPKEWLPIEGAAHSNSHQVGDVQYQAALIKFKKTYLLTP
jgi:alpha-beta hydrolase superfamily lysophospholipase